VYVLDEPTTGLHFEDIRKLLGVLQSLVDKGNTVIVIEHNLDVIKTSDWIVDMGPHGGTGGGVVVVEGTPEEVAGHATSYTGDFLRPLVTPAPARKPRPKRKVPTAGQPARAVKSSARRAAQAS
jgi:excinuclease ABC subunit A